MSHHRQSYTESEGDILTLRPNDTLLFLLMVFNARFQCLNNVFVHHNFDSFIFLCALMVIMNDVSLHVKISLLAIAGALLDLVQLFAALKDNTSMTSIDLSNNVITDEGMSFLTGALAVGMVPNLLRINLQGNPISSKGRELLAGLYHLRKQLLVSQITSINSV